MRSFHAHPYLTLRAPDGHFPRYINYFFMVKVIVPGWWVGDGKIDLLLLEMLRFSNDSYMFRDFTGCMVVRLTNFYAFLCYVLTEF